MIRAIRFGLRALMQTVWLCCLGLFLTVVVCCAMLDHVEDRGSRRGRG